jgi:hypothetical protein
LFQSLSGDRSCDGIIRCLNDAQTNDVNASTNTKISSAEAMDRSDSLIMYCETDHSLSPIYNNSQECSAMDDGEQQPCKTDPHTAKHPDRAVTEFAFTESDEEEIDDFDKDLLKHAINRVSKDRQQQNAKHKMKRDAQQPADDPQLMIGPCKCKYYSNQFDSVCLKDVKFDRD